KRGKRQVLVRPSSKVVTRFLLVMQKHGYIGEFEEIDDHRSGKIVIQLNGRLNKCGAISPRFDVQLDELEKLVNNLLPSRQFGFVVLTTSAGIMDHQEARRKHTGGKILGQVHNASGIDIGGADAGDGIEEPRRVRHARQLRNESWLTSVQTIHVQELVCEEDDAPGILSSGMRTV
ncbi:6274_t:CDS:2, partial [Paraglomus brasilianum]